jgi:hypothetical protein
MATLEGFAKQYDRWRRKTLPQSIDDAGWRHDELRARLIEIKDLLLPHFTQTSASGTKALQDELRAVLRLLEPQKAIGVSKKRVGSPGDGGYVQLDDLEGVTHAFSFGVCDDDAWDLEMAQAGVPVEQFDHSVESAPSTHPLLHFHRKMIAAHPGPDRESLAALVAEFSKSEKPDLFLKMDIEGSEWDVLDATPEALLAKHAQIVCEFHDLSQLLSPHFYFRAKRVFEKLHRLFAVTHVHANNCVPFNLLANIPLPEVLEISFANRARYRFEPSDEVFPTPLDAPCSPQRPDYILGAFRF